MKERCSQALLSMKELDGSLDSASGHLVGRVRRMHDQHSPVGLAIESNARPGRGALLVQLVAQRLHDADEISEAEGTGLRHKKAVQLFHLSHNPSPYATIL